MKSKKLILLVLGILCSIAAAGVALTSSNSIAVDSAGKITNSIDRLRAAVQGVRFWEQQLELVDRELDDLTTEPERPSSEMVSEMTREREEFYEKLKEIAPKSVPTDSELEARRLREKADEIEMAELRGFLEEYTSERIGYLQSLRPIIEAKIGRESPPKN